MTRLMKSSTWSSKPAQTNPDLTKLDMKKLIRGIQEGHEQLVEKDTRIEAVTVELENVVGQLDPVADGEQNA